jgi:DNA repair exonuclease SbcCD ATPase subunit
MDWLKKLLEGKGLSEDQIKSIVEGVEGNYKGYVPPHRFEEVNTAKKQLETDLKDRNTQLEELKKNTGDHAELKKQIEKLQEDNKMKDDDYQAKIKDMTISSALKMALTGDAHDPDLLAGLLDKSKIEVGEDGKVKAGLEDQLKTLREAKSFLFVPKQTPPGQPQFRGASPADGRDPNGGGGGQPQSLTDAVSAYYNKSN